MFRYGFALFIFSFGSVLHSEDDSAARPTPAVEKIGQHRYRLGGIEFDAETREVSVPVAVNMREGGPLEYVLVHENGKIHESIFVTEISPHDLQVAMKLVKYKAGSGDVFNSLLRPEDIEEEGGKEGDRGESVTFSFLPDDGEEIAVASTVYDGIDSVPLDEGGWIFTGSLVDRGDFMAEIEGSIIAIYLDANAMFNMTRPGADNDDRWGANKKLIPEIGTKGALLIRPDGADRPMKTSGVNVIE